MSAVLTTIIVTGVGVGVGGASVGVGDTGVNVGGTAVGVGGSCVGVGGAIVSVGGTAVAVGGAGVGVGISGVAMGVGLGTQPSTASTMIMKKVTKNTVSLFISDLLVMQGAYCRNRTLAGTGGPTARRLSRVQRRRAQRAEASVGSNRMLGGRERNEREPNMRRSRRAEARAAGRGHASTAR